MNRPLDLSGLSPEAVAVVEQLVAVLKKQASAESLPAGFTTRLEWRQAIRNWAESHAATENFVNWDRDEVYAGCGE